MQTYKSLFVYYTRGGCIVLSLLLVSCNNFLDAGKVKDDIQDAIAYNNAKEINIQIDSEGMGLTTPNGSVSKKIGYDFEIQFKPDTDNYVLIDKTSIFEAVNYYDRTQSLDEFVTYSAAFQTEEDKIYGIYRQKIKVNKEVTGLCLRPKCQMLPVITQKTPDYTANGVYANLPVKVYFSMPMELPETTSADSVFNYHNIKITYKGQNVKDWFYEPKFSSDKTVLSIEPKGRVIKDYILNNSLTVVEVDFEFGENLCAQTEEEIIPFKQNQNSTFTICYNEHVEENPPEKKAFFVTREAITLEDALTLPDAKKFAQKLVLEQLTEANPDSSKYLNDDEIMKNRVKDFAYVYGRYYDAESGVREVEIKERCTNKWSDKTTVDEPVIPHYFDETSPDIKFFDEGTGYVSFVLKCPVESIDGAVLFDVVVKDACGNKADKESLAVIKKSTAVNNINNLYMENIPQQVCYQNLFTYDYYLSNYKVIKIYGGNSQKLHLVNDRVYGDYVDVSNYTLTAEYVDRSGKIKTQPFKKCNPQDYLRNDVHITTGWSCDLDVNTVAGLDVKVIIEDDIGNVDGKVFSFPSNPQMVYKTASKIEDVYGNGAYNFIKSGNQFLQVQSGSDIQNEEERFVVSVSGVGTDFYMFGDMNGPYTSLSDEDFIAMENAIPQIGNVSTSWERNAEKPDKSYLKIEVDNWNQFDRLIICSSGCYYFDYYPDMKLEYNSVYGFSKYNIEIIGIKGKVKTKKTVPTTVLNYDEDPSVIEFDNVPPRVEAHSTASNGDEVFILKDSGIGPKNAVITLNNGKTYSIDSTTEFKRTIPKHELDLVRGQKNIVVGTYVAYDKAGRSNTGELKVSVTNDFWFTGVEDLGSKNYKLYGDTVSSFNVLEWTIPREYLDANTQWQEESDLRRSPTQTETSGVYTYTVESAPLNHADSFYRLSRPYYNAIPLYYYTGRKSSGNFDYVLRDNAQEAVVVSDSKVYAHTLYVNRPYEDCRNWTADEWEIYGKGVGDTLIDFPENEDDVLPKKYTVPLREIPSGACYCVVFHFANDGLQHSANATAYIKQ